MSDDITLSDDQLKAIAERSEQSATQALSKLAGIDVRVSTKEARSIDVSEVGGVFGSVGEHDVIAHTQTAAGAEGSSVLAMERKDALKMVDVLNKREEGTTVVMQEIDRSTIKETLNILGNAYATELAKDSGQTILLTVPTMISRSQADTLANRLKAEKGKRVFFFETNLSAGEADVVVKLYYLFLITL